MSVRVVMSTRPTVRMPNSAGSAPVISDMLPIRLGVQNAAEAGDAVGQHDAVDAELHVGVIVADVDRAAGRGILRHAGRLQQHFLDRALVPCGSAWIASWLSVSDVVPMVV